MKLYITILFASTVTISLFGQDCSEFKKHLKSIDSTYYPGNVVDRMDTLFNANTAFVDYTIDNLLDKPSYKCFISNRNLLKKLKLLSCDSHKIIIRDTLKNGEICNITLTTGTFEPKNHKIVANEDSSTIKEIDDQYPYGGVYGIPKIEIKNLNLEINGLRLNIPHSTYGNFYYPNLCENYGFIRQVEAFESLNGKYIYLYLYGGNAAGTYFAKLIFDKTKYITKIVSDYYPLSIHSSFIDNFIGF